MDYCYWAIAGRCTELDRTQKRQFAQERLRDGLRLGAPHAVASRDENCGIGRGIELGPQGFRLVDAGDPHQQPLQTVLRCSGIFTG